MHCFLLLVAVADLALLVRLNLLDGVGIDTFLLVTICDLLIYAFLCLITSRSGVVTLL